MRKFFVLSIIWLVSYSAVLAQGETEIKTLFDSLSLKQISSRDIIIQSEAKTITKGCRKNLQELSSFFSDTTQTNIISECNSLPLNKGEIAIILADHIEIMPYAKLTGIENHLLQFCEKNPNKIEYYIVSIRRLGIIEFQNRYTTWLSSKERKKWILQTTGVILR